jgi:hypothetical protein
MNKFFILLGVLFGLLSYNAYSAPSTGSPGNPLFYQPKIVKLPSMNSGESEKKIQQETNAQQISAQQTSSVTQIKNDEVMECSSGCNHARLMILLVAIIPVLLFTGIAVHSLLKDTSKK